MICTDNPPTTKRGTARGNSVFAIKKKKKKKKKNYGAVSLLPCHIKKERPKHRVRPERKGLKRTDTGEQGTHHVGRGLSRRINSRKNPRRLGVQGGEPSGMKEGGATNASRGWGNLPCAPILKKKHVSKRGKPAMYVFGCIGGRNS